MTSNGVELAALQQVENLDCSIVAGDDQEVSTRMEVNGINCTLIDPIILTNFTRFQAVELNSSIAEA